MKKTINSILALMSFILISAAAISCKSTPKDSEILTAVNEKINSVPEMAGLTADVKDGVVTLGGACKDEACKALGETTVKALPGVKSVVNNATIVAPEPVAAPVTISPDEALNKGVTDALKDFSTVKASVADGVVTLTGEAKKTDVPKIMMAVNSLNPRQVKNEIVIK